MFVNIMIGKERRKVSYPFSDMNVRTFLNKFEQEYGKDAFLLYGGNKYDGKGAYSNVKFSDIGIEDEDDIVVYIPVKKNILIVGASDEKDEEKFKTLIANNYVTFASNAPSKSLTVPHIYMDFNDLCSTSFKKDVFDLIFLDKYTLKFMRKPHKILFALLISMLKNDGLMTVSETNNYGAVPMLNYDMPLDKKSGAGWTWPLNSNIFQPRENSIRDERGNIWPRGHVDKYNDIAKSTTAAFFDSIGANTRFLFLALPAFGYIEPMYHVDVTKKEERKKIDSHIFDNLCKLFGPAEGSKSSRSSKSRNKSSSKSSSKSSRSKSSISNRSSRSNRSRSRRRLKRHFTSL